MKKKLFIIVSFALIFIFVGCKGKDTYSRLHELKTKIKTKEKAPEVAPVMEEITTSDTSEDDEPSDYIGNENYRKLMAIAAKCDDPDFSLYSLSQSDYAFMISFCNMMMDTAEEADMAGRSEEYQQEFQEFQELLEGFAMLLSAAYTEDMLDSANSHDFEVMMRRAQYVSQ